MFLKEDINKLRKPVIIDSRHHYKLLKLSDDGFFDHVVLLDHMHFNAMPNSFEIFMKHVLP